MHRSIGAAVLLVSTVGTSWGRVQSSRGAVAAAGSHTAQLQDQAAPAPPKPLPGIAQKTEGFKKLAGYFNLYWDEREGKLWLEIGQWDTEFLYIDSLPQGVGSNDIGLDRGQPGESRVVKFERVGPKVLSGSAQLLVSRRDQQSRRAADGRRGFCPIGSVGVHGRSRKRRPCPGGRDRLLPTRRTQCCGRAQGNPPGRLRRRRFALRDIPGPHQELPAQH